MKRSPRLIIKREEVARQYIVWTHYNIVWVLFSCIKLFEIVYTSHLYLIKWDVYFLHCLFLYSFEFLHRLLIPITECNLARARTSFSPVCHTVHSAWRREDSQMMLVERLLPLHMKNIRKGGWASNFIEVQCNSELSCSVAQRLLKLENLNITLDQAKGQTDIQCQTMCFWVGCC